MTVRLSIGDMVSPTRMVISRAQREGGTRYFWGLRCVICENEVSTSYVKGAIIHKCTVCRDRPLNSSMESAPDGEWRPIEGFPGYEISNLGVARSLPKELVMVPHNRESYTYTVKGYMLGLFTNKFGYVRCNLAYFTDGKRNPITIDVHRLVAKAFVPNPENKPHVNHINGIKSDNRAENLEWVTRRENIDHAMANGLLPKGSDHVRAKLKEEDIPVIRELIKSGLKNFTIGKMYGVDHQTISKIRLGINWKHIK